MRKKLSVFLIAVGCSLLMVPSPAFAKWWNPGTWRNPLKAGKDGCSIERTGKPCTCSNASESTSSTGTCQLASETHPEPHCCCAVYDENGDEVGSCITQ